MNTRQWRLVRLLNRGEHFSARMLAEECQVSIRTIQRDMTVLEANGYPIYSEPGVAGGYRMLPHRNMPPLVLTDEETIVFFILLEWISQIPDFPFGTIRQEVAERYANELPKMTEQQIVKWKDRFRFQAVDTPPSPQNPALLDLLESGRMGNILYETTKGRRMIVVDPIGLSFEQNRWYFYGQTNRGYRQFRVDRIKDVTLHELPATELTFSDLEQDMTRVPMTTVKLEVSPLGERLLEGILPIQSERTWLVP
ncbi:MAG TPA: transcriptional regulator, partial [Exiguobacterium sp.]|nr:transcriptional regulator [Exiguobacterium sp.]